VAEEWTRGRSSSLVRFDHGLIHAIRPCYSAAFHTPFNAVSTPFNATSTPFNAVSAPFNAVSTPFNAVSTPFNATSTPFNAVSAPFNAVSTPFQGRRVATTPASLKTSMSRKRFSWQHHCSILGIVSIYGNN
jgi:hypothetical protein